MNTFPLFDMIYTETESHYPFEEDSFCEKVKKMDDEGYELMYVLMKCYALKFNLDTNSPPFHPKKYKNTFKYDVTVLPPRLLKMLVYFTDKHTQKLKEESLRPNQNL